MEMCAEKEEKKYEKISTTTKIISVKNDFFRKKRILNEGERKKEKSIFPSNFFLLPFFWKTETKPLGMGNQSVYAS
jgi:hypothetical protein